MRLECEDCVLRPLTMADAPALARHANDERIAVQLRDRFPHPYSIDDAQAFIGAVARPGAVWGVDVAGEVVGAIGLERRTDIFDRTAEIGFWIGRAHQGRGLASQAVRAVTDHAFAQGEVQRLEGLVLEGNGPSERVLEKNGYLREGVMRAAATKAGRLLSVALYARVREES